MKRYNKWIHVKMTTLKCNDKLKVYHTNLCPKCDKESIIQTIYCPHCGKRLRKERTK